jgi:adenylosuccinate synthase
MKVNVLLGLQWGDEGKGKIVDYLAPQYQVVARFQGGPNAGHTLTFNGIKHVLHQIPSGIFRHDILNIIGNGVVLDAVILKKEIEALTNFNLDLRKNLFISKKTALILPTHRLLDAALEKAKGEKKIGSTLKGIGPAYQDKIGRHGLRVGDILNADFKACYRNLVAEHESILRYHKFEYDLEVLEKPFFEAVEFLKEFNLVDSEYLLNEKITSGDAILAEGAQGSLLDIDFGSYPFVTSSSTVTAGACTGLGISPHNIGEVYGIFKAYCTRVGSGPFPTELHDEFGEKIRKAGQEFGATTGRPRRCGWLDLPALKYSIMLNGVTQLFMMKADVLNEFEEIRVCTHYELPDGTTTENFTYESMQEGVTPIYKTLPGWNCNLKEIRKFENMPDALQDYVSYLENQLDVPINIVSIGPDREQTIIRKEVLEGA